MWTVLLSAPLPEHCCELVLQPLGQERVEVVLLALCVIEEIVTPPPPLFFPTRGCQILHLLGILLFT